MDYLQYIKEDFNVTDFDIKVLNLIINGLPSILLKRFLHLITKDSSFKPYYKWITFNTRLKQ